MAHFVIMPDGNRVNLDTIVSWSASGAIITFYPNSGATPPSYTADNSTVAQKILTLIDAFAFQNTNASLNIDTALGVMVYSVAPLPASAGGGGTETITGRGFVTGASVFLAGNQVDPATVTVVSATSITFTAPSNAVEPWLDLYNNENGQIPLTVTNTDGGTFTLAANFGWT